MTTNISACSSKLILKVLSYWNLAARRKAYKKAKQAAERGGAVTLSPDDEQALLNGVAKAEIAATPKRKSDGCSKKGR